MMKRSMLVLLFILLVFALSACGGTTTSTPPTDAPAAANPTASGPDADSDGIPDSAEPVLGTDENNADSDGDGTNDLEDSAPMLAENPIQEESTTAGYTIDVILVENNENEDGTSARDHLEITVTNVTDSDISNFEVFYTITDPTTNTVQAYYRTLPDFTLPAGATMAIHFDNTGVENHFSVNPNSAYYTNPNGQTVELTLHADGYAPVTASVDKDPVGLEGPED